jgi:LEA14-like dessication related protein
MKNFSLLLLFISIQFSLAQSQNELLFKIQYNPETKYEQTLDQSNHVELKYAGEPEFMQTLKDKGVQNPTIVDSHSVIESVMKTGKLSNNTNFPLTIEFLKTTNSDNKIQIPDGTIIYGKGTLNNLPTLDSISSKGLSDELKKTIMQTMQSFFTQLNIPERKVKVGDVFDLDTPFSIPIAGMQMDMTITTTYKLLSIKNNVGDFDVSQVCTMNTSATQFPMSATGTGKGKLQYDTVNNFNLNFQIDMEMTANMKIEKIELGIITKMEMLQSAKISKI